MTNLSVTCSNCYESLNDEERFNPYRDESGVLCDDCQHEMYMDTCECCCNIVEKTELESAPGSLIAIWRDAPTDTNDDLKPGYYRVVTWPIFTAPMIGDGWLHTNALRSVSDIDDAGQRATADAWPNAGPICHECRYEIESRLFCPPNS